MQGNVKLYSARCANFMLSTPLNECSKCFISGATECRAMTENAPGILSVQLIQDAATNVHILEL